MVEYLDEKWPEWQKARELIRGELMDVSYRTWIVPLVPIKLEEGQLYIQVPSPYARNFLMPRYNTLIENAFSQVNGKGYEVHFVLPEEAEDLKKPGESPQDDRELQTAASMMLNPKYTFDTFVIGNSNMFAHAAALAVAEAPAQAYNPLFIYGGVGLGKTHLLHAIGHFIRQQNPQMRIMYTSSEKFTNELINGIKTNSTQAFRNRYRNVDVLLIDDIQFIAGKDSTQEELFHTFNALHDAQKQIIFSSDKPPKEMQHLEERLRSRFEWGLIADIQPPDLETRIAILRKKAEAEGTLSVPDDVMEFIATNSENNIRELEGALTRVIAYSRLSQQDISIPLAQQALKDILENNATRKATPENIIRIVCERYGITPKDFLSRRRNQEIAYPRKLAMYLVRELTDLSLSDIGKAFGGRDHTTVLHAWRTISEEMAQNRELRSMLADIRRQITEK